MKTWPEAPSHDMSLGTLKGDCKLETRDTLEDQSPECGACPSTPQ